MNEFRGRIFGQYEILEELGRGGMGVVYKARDSRLERFVALKFLPQHIRAGEAEKARFLQEARAAAGLNHPNICSVIAIEDIGDHQFIVMELVEGQTLDRKKNSVGQKEAIEIGIQIAEGLAAAHEKGIVHRDIKPENVMIRKDHLVQIMDFGLAKLRSGEGTRLTREGSTVGTAAYMSPEQVQGQDVDHRADIFSFGVLLYELLAGELPFRGAHETALLYEIVNVDPAPISAVKPDIDPELDRIILECLQKEPDERYQSAAEIAKELRRYKRESSRQRMSRIVPARPIAPNPIGSTATSSSKAPSQKRLIGWFALTAVLLATIAFAAIRSWDRPHVVAPMVMRFSITLPPTTPLMPGLSTIAISPDGKHLVYLANDAGTQRLYLRPLNRLVAVAIGGTENATDPFFSRDGKWICFGARGRLKKVSLFGGAPQDISDSFSAMRGGYWADDNAIYLGQINGAIYRVSSDGGVGNEVTILDSANREISHRFPQLLPDGKTIIFTVKHNDIASFDEAVIVAENIETHVRTVLVRGGSYARYSPSGHLVYARGTHVLAVGFNPSTLEIQGSPLPVAMGGSLNLLSGTANFDVSSTGVFVYVPMGPNDPVKRTLALMDRQGKVESVLDDLRPYNAASFSPDGQKLALTILAANDDIWIYNLMRRTLTRLTFGGGNSSRPAWSPDGSRVVYFSERGRSLRIFAKSWDGRAAEEQIGEMSADGVSAATFTPDGKIMAFDRNGDIWITKLDGERQSEPFIQSPAFESHPSISPDGGWMAYISGETGRGEMYVVPFPTGEGKWQVSTNGATGGAWIPPGKELVYRNGRELMKVDTKLGATFDFSPPQKICDIPESTFALWDRSPDGRKFIVGMNSDASTSATHINVEVGWFEELNNIFSASQR